MNLPEALVIITGIMCGGPMLILIGFFAYAAWDGRSSLPNYREYKREPLKERGPDPASQPQSDQVHLSGGPESGDDKQSTRDYPEEK